MASTIRSATIDLWRHRLLDAIGPIHTLCDFLTRVEAIAPKHVDADHLLSLVENCNSSLNDLGRLFECQDFSAFVQTVTGHSDWMLIIAREIRNRAGSTDRWQCEIDAIRADKPAIADELQALLDQHFAQEAVDA